MNLASERAAVASWLSFTDQSERGTDALHAGCEKEMTDLSREIERHYAVRRAPRMGMEKKPALLIVDFVEGFTSKNSPLAGNWDKEVAFTAKLLEVARKK